MKNLIQVGYVFVFIFAFTIITTFLFTRNEPTDTQCVEATTIQELKNVSYKDYNNVCKSLDKFISTTQVFDSKDSNVELFKANKYINESQAKTKNDQQRQLYKAEQKKNKTKQALFFYIVSFSMILYVTTMIIINVVYHKMTFEVGLKKTIYVVIILLLLLIIRDTNEISRSVKRATNEVGNFTGRALTKPFLNDMTTNIDKLLDSSFYVANNEIDKLSDIATCMSNNQKYHISLLEGDTRNFQSHKDLTDFYVLKNEPYFSQYEDMELNKIQYVVSRVNGYTTLKKVNFAGCGSIDLITKDFSKDLSNVMRHINFSRILNTAVSSNDYQSGWEKLLKDFDKAYAISNRNAGVLEETFMTLYGQNDAYDNMKKQLLVAYTIEFKKGLTFGFVGTDTFGVPDRDISDFTNMKTKMNSLESWYDKLNESVCINNTGVMRKTLDIYKHNDFENTNYMSFYYCMNFKDEGEVEPIHNRVYALDENVDQEVAFEEVIVEAQQIYTSLVDDLANQYKEIDEAFIANVQEAYNLEEKAVRLWNEGFYSMPKLLSHLTQSSFGYKEMFNEVVSVMTFDTQKAMPYFATMSKEEALYNFYTVADVKAAKPMIVSSDNLDSLIQSGDIATVLLTNQYGNQSLKSTSDDIGFGDVIDVMQNKVGNVYENFEHTLCKSSKIGFDTAECIQTSLDGAGHERVTKAVEDSKVLGITAVTSSFAFKGAQMVFMIGSRSASASGDKDKDTIEIGKEKKKPKKSKFALADGFVAGAAMIEGILFFVGTALYTLASLQEVAVKIPEFLAVYQQLTVSTFFMHFDEIMIVVLLMSLMSIHKNKAEEIGMTKIFHLTFSYMKNIPLFLGCTVIFIVVFIYFLNIMPLLLDFDSPTSYLQVGFYIMMMLILLVFFPVYLMTSILNLADSLDETGGIKTQVDEGANSVNNVVKTNTTGIALGFYTKGLNGISKAFQNATKPKDEKNKDK
ncbi:hypothetical protein [Vibrio penaeicida]|uniref:hypothetical protein n=1 Tax=Vibrio penaeicida TaxID=104609 RepID=UPI001CC5FFF2|nr:hypothetical protein [Vibrio penaeicida]